MKPRIHTMNLKQAVDAFDRKVAAARVPNFQSGKFGSISQARRDVIVSNVRVALREAAQTSDVDEVELGPYLEVLPDAALRDAVKHELSQPETRASNCRLFLATVRGRRKPLKQRRYVKRESFIASWRPLYDAMRRAKTPRQQIADLAWFHDLILFRKGEVAPAEIPDGATIQAWVTPENQERFPRGVRAFRRATSLLGCPAIPLLQTLAEINERGLNSLPDLAERLRAVDRKKRHASNIPLLEKIRLLAPLIGEVVDDYREWAKSSKRDLWLDQSIPYAFSVLVAGLIRMGYDVAHLDLIDLYLTQTPAASRKSPGKLIARHAPNANGTVPRSIMRQLMESAAPRIAERSPLGLAEDTTIPSEEVPFFPPGLERDLDAYFSVARDYYGRNLGQGGGLIDLNPTKWDAVVREDKAIRTAMSDLNKRRHVVGHIDKSLICIPWSHAVCVGVPMLRSEAIAARDAYYEALDGNEDDGSETTTALAGRRDAYARRLYRYFAYAFPLDDGLRAANYIEACWNHHLIPTYEVVAGQVVAVASLDTNWSGYDTLGRLKRATTKAGRENRRARGILPGIIDMELLSDFVLVIRPIQLVRLGLIPSVSAYDPQEDHFALFLSPRSTCDTGGYASSRPLSPTFGSVLNEVMRMIGYKVRYKNNQNDKTIPTIEDIKADPDLRATWRGLWGEHIVRQLIATYFGGVLDDWQHASWLTNDDPQTLKDYYLEYSDAIAQSLEMPGIQNAHHFDEVIRSLRAGIVPDWDNFDPHNPKI